MAAVVRREQFANAVLGLRMAQSLADDALVVYYTTARSDEGVATYHLAELERSCDRMERRIAAFRMELEAQRSRVAPIPDEVRL
jgi:hypothetical protein